MKIKIILLAILGSISLFGCAPSDNNGTDAPAAQEYEDTNEEIPIDPDEEPIDIDEDIPADLEDEKEAVIEEEDATDDADEPIVTIEPFIATFTPKFTVKIDNDYYLSDGTQTESWQSGNIQQAGPMIFTIEDQLIEFDTAGDQISTTQLSYVPTAIKSTGDSIYYCITIDPETALSLGAQYRYYTEYYKDNELLSQPWYFNQYECHGIESVGENVFLIDENGAYIVIDGLADNVSHVVDNRFYMHNIDYNSQEIGFNEYVESFELNYVAGSDQWILFDGLEYSETGAIWSDSGLMENATALSDFNAAPYPIEPALILGQQPTLLAVGDHEGKLYWIECDSGWLFEYDPTLDNLVQTWRIYAGDGMRITGVEKRDSLKPLLVDGKLYFSNDGSVNRIDILTGFIDVFYAGEGEVFRYE